MISVTFISEAGVTLLEMEYEHPPGLGDEVMITTEAGIFWRVCSRRWYSPTVLGCAVRVADRHDPAADRRKA